MKRRMTPDEEREIVKQLPIFRRLKDPEIFITKKCEELFGFTPDLTEYIGYQPDGPDEAKNPPTGGSNVMPPGYVTRDSGERKEFRTGMQRDTNINKPRYDLVTPLDCPINILDRWAMLMERGARKYSQRNWEKAGTQEEFDRFMESAERHFQQWKKQILGISDDGEDHAAAICFNVQGAEYTKWKLSK